MLDEHFEDQMNEVIKLCPVSRQTMLFSATMTDQVTLRVKYVPIPGYIHVHLLNFHVHYTLAMYMYNGREN